MRIGDGQVITTTIEGVVFIAREIIVLPVGIVNLGLYVYETCDQTVEQYARMFNATRKPRTPAKVCLESARSGRGIVKFLASSQRQPS
jgi:hypothetical protein